MPTQAEEKWPTFFQIKKVVHSVLGEELSVYMITGLVSKEQADEVRNVINLISEFNMEDDRLVVSSLLTQQQFEKLSKNYKPLAKKWRGKWQALAKAIDSACKSVMESQAEPVK